MTHSYAMWYIHTLYIYMHKSSRYGIWVHLPRSHLPRIPYWLYVCIYIYMCIYIYIYIYIYTLHTYIRRSSWYHLSQSPSTSNTIPTICTYVYMYIYTYIHYIYIYIEAVVMVFESIYLNPIYLEYHTDCFLIACISSFTPRFNRIPYQLAQPICQLAESITQPIGWANGIP